MDGCGKRVSSALTGLQNLLTRHDRILEVTQEFVGASRFPQPQKRALAEHYLFFEMLIPLRRIRSM